MYDRSTDAVSVTKWQDLHRLRTPTSSQLDSIKAHLDLVILAIASSAKITKSK